MNCLKEINEEFHYELTNDKNIDFIILEFLRIRVPAAAVKLWERALFSMV